MRTIITMIATVHTADSTSVIILRPVSTLESADITILSGTIGIAAITDTGHGITILILTIRDISIIGIMVGG